VLLKKVLNRAAQAIVLPLGDQWVLAVARQGGARAEIEHLSTFAREGKDVAALKRIAGQYNAKNTALGTLLVSGEYQLLQTDAPDITDPEELKAALRWKIKDMIDFPADQATLDCFDVQQGGAATGRGRQVFVAVARNDVLRPRVALFQDARLPLSVIDIPEMGMRNIARLFEQESRGLVLLNFTEISGMLLFTFGGELCAVRRIELTLTQLETAEVDRRNDLFDRVALEVQRSIDNFERQFNTITLSRLVTAEMPSVPGLLEYLRGYLSIKVEPLDLSEVIDFPAVPELRKTRRQAELMPVIGAALRADANG
jgi:MSHA biogenesis protein MshI